MTIEQDWVTIHQVGDRHPYHALVERPKDTEHTEAFLAWSRDSCRTVSVTEYPTLLVVKDLLARNIPIVALERYFVELQKMQPLVAARDVARLMQEMSGVPVEDRMRVIDSAWLQSRGVVFQHQDPAGAQRIRNPKPIPAEVIPWIEVPEQPVIMTCDRDFCNRTLIIPATVKRVAAYTPNADWMGITREYVAQASEDSSVVKTAVLVP